MPSRIKSNLQKFSAANHDFINKAIPYVGLHDNGNLGDEELFRLAGRFLGIKNFGFDVHNRGRFIKLSLLANSGYFILGGGSLIFSNAILNQCERIIGAGGKIIVFGSGYTDSLTNQGILIRWKNIFENAELIGVRGESTRCELEKIGVTSQVIGDMGYLVNLDIENPAAPKDYVLINARSIPKDNLFQKDERTRRLLFELIKKISISGIQIIVLIAFKDADNEIVEEWIDQIPINIEVVYYSGEYEPIAEIIKYARAIVTMRMHPGIFGIAYGVPVIMLDSRKKFYDSLSPLNGLAHQIDPESTNLRKIVGITRDLINEGFQSREERFQKVRKVALNQKEYCDSIKEFVNK